MNVQTFLKRKQNNEKLTMVTAYDYWTAKIIKKTDIDIILVGDSVAMVMYGYPTTLQATTDMIAQHVSMVARAASKKFIVGDLPFLSFRKGIRETMNAVEMIMRNGAEAVKLEGISGHEDTITHIVESGVPVMGHLGLTPQSIHALGGYKVQARSEQAKSKLLEDAKKLEQLGCFSVVLECVPDDIAEKVTHTLAIPTIGIGAGLQVDGQVLVLQDLLGMDSEFRPKFVRTFINGESILTEAINRFCHTTQTGSFPNKSESYP